MKKLIVGISCYILFGGFLAIGLSSLFSAFPVSNQDILFNAVENIKNIGDSIKKIFPFFNGRGGIDGIIFVGLGVFFGYLGTWYLKNNNESRD